jgi:hypothetical protein
VGHQVIELPDTIAVTTEHRLMKVCCPGCRTHTRAELPADVEAGAFGPRLRATVVMLAAMLMSRRATLTLLRDMFGARIGLGSVENILKSASDALAAPWEAIKRAVQQADVANADETSWARAGQRLWLWAALSASAACYRIDSTRARTAARELLGDFDGLLISDRYSVYDFIDPDRRQVCLARNFQAFAERPGGAGRHGQTIKQILDEVMRADTQARADGITIAWHSGPGGDIHDRLMDAVEAGERSHTPELARLWRDRPGHLANAVELHRAPRRRGHQQPRRTRAAPRRAVAQNQQRHPDRHRRALRQTDPLDPRNLPPQQPVAARLPRRSPQRTPHRHADPNTAAGRRMITRLPTKPEPERVPCRCVASGPIARPRIPLGHTTRRSSR